MFVISNFHDKLINNFENCFAINLRILKKIFIKYIRLDINHDKHFEHNTSNDKKNQHKMII